MGVTAAQTIGREGLQLFVDAGQAVSNQLVNALVREVIAEKVSSMLGRRGDNDGNQIKTRVAVDNNSVGSQRDFTTEDFAQVISLTDFFFINFSKRI